MSMVAASQYSQEDVQRMFSENASHLQEWDGLQNNGNKIHRRYIRQAYPRPPLIFVPVPLP